MQWLIDIVVEAVIAQIGIPPCYIDRGDPDNADFARPVLDDDGDFHPLDLSAIVPAGAVAVAMRVGFNADQVAKVFILEKNGLVHHWNTSVVRQQVANAYTEHDKVVPLDTARKIQYMLSAGTVTAYALTVKGWWL